MKQKICVHKTVRLLSIVALPVLILTDILLLHAPIAARFSVDVYCALQILMLYPVTRDPAAPSLVAAGVSLALFMLLKTVDAPGWAFVLACQSILLLFITRKILIRYKEVPPLFHVSAVWAGVEDHLYLYHVVAFMLMGTVLLASLYGPSAVWHWLSLGLGCILFCLQYYRVFARTTLLLGSSKEEQIKNGQRSSCYKMPVQYVDSDSRSATLFNDVVRIMETRKPYLQDDFSVDDLARLTHTNRMYLSKAVNFHSGRNFNQMVNYYRVKYAVELIKKDPSLKMNELSQMCGFHTVVSFNMAFKLNERMTPSEYARSVKVVKLNPGSRASSPEGER